MLAALSNLAIVAVGVTAQGSLHDAVGADDVGSIKDLLSSGANINEIGPGGQTPLMFAVLSGKKRAAKLLLARGADTSIGEKDGYTPMHGAGYQQATSKRTRAQKCERNGESFCQM